MSNDKKKIIPVGNYVLVEMDKAPTREGLIYLIEPDEFLANVGTVIGVGTGDNGKEVELPEGISIGDRVVVHNEPKKFTKITLIQEDGAKFMACPVDEIVGKIED